MNVIELKLNLIKPYEKNPRNNKPAIDAVANSIKEFGFKVPIVIDKDNVIVCGHTRYAAAKKLGLEKVPCIKADDLSDKQIKAFRLADNKTAELAEWDLTLLDEEISELADFDMEQFGFGFLEQEEETEIVEVDVPKVTEEFIAKYGDIYELGNHRLMCGDSTSEQDVSELMNGNYADLMMTDPPYNVNVSNSDGMTIENDNMSSNAFANFLNYVFENASKVLKAGGAFYVWHGDNETVNFRTAMSNHELLIKQCLIWVKNGSTFGRSDYHWRHEPCLYGWKEGAAHYFINDFTQDTVIEDKIDINKLKKEEMKDLLKELLSEKTPSTIIHEDKPLKNDLHPTMKPVRLIAKLIKNSSKTDEIVLDLFGGSGTTMVACEQLNRKCYMMEYDPRYVDVIIKRWEQLTGLKAKQIKFGS